MGRSSTKRAFGKYKLTAFWLFLVFAVGYLLKSPERGTESVISALSVCGLRLIPGIFPFIVLVNIINRSGLPAFVARLLGKPISLLFGVTPTAAYAFVLGLLGGFPIGAVCVSELYRSGRVDVKEAEKLSVLINLASPAFCISAIGNIFGDMSFGLRLYLCQIAAALTLAILTRKKGPIPPEKKAAIISAPPLQAITSAINDSGSTIVKICSFVIFFAVIGDGAASVAGRFFGEAGEAVTAVFFEITLAVRKSALLDSPLAELLSAFAVGYGGLSVHMQTAAVLDGCPISLKRQTIWRLVLGLVCSLYLYLWQFFL